MVNFIIKGQVIPLKSHRPIYINKATGRPFLGKDKRLRDYEKSAKAQLKEQYKGELMKGPVRAGFLFWVKDNRKRDLINLMETIQDVLQGIVIENDSQIKGYNWAFIAGVHKDNPLADIDIVRDEK